MTRITRIERKDKSRSAPSPPPTTACAAGFPTVMSSAVETSLTADLGRSERCLDSLDMTKSGLAFLLHFLLLLILILTFVSETELIRSMSRIKSRSGGFYPCHPRFNPCYVIHPR